MNQRNNLKIRRMRLISLLIIMAFLSLAGVAKAMDPITLPTVLKGTTKVEDSYTNRTIYGGFTGNEVVYNYPGSYEEGNGQLLLNKKIDIAAGSNHSCALKSDGTVVCWGYNPQGYLGDGTTVERAYPVNVIGIDGDLSGKLDNVSSIHAGWTNSCAILEDTKIVCWGSGQYGRNGDGDVSNNLYPAYVWGVGGTPGSYLDDVIDVGIGSTHMCALRSDTSVACWGSQLNGVLGNGSIASGSLSSPVEVKDSTGLGKLSGVVSIGVGSYHTCALKSSGEVLCWGQNLYNRLGNNSTATSALPVSVSNTDGSGPLTSVAFLRVGADASCAKLKDSNNIVCWGRNDYGQLGDGTTNGTKIPVYLKSSAGVLFSSQIRELSMGGNHACLVDSSQNSLCWGRNNAGQLGNGDTTNRLYPTYVSSPDGPPSHLDKVNNVKLGQSFSFASREDGSVLSWGYNIHYQLGDGTQIARRLPVSVLGVGGQGYQALTSTQGIGYDLFGFYEGTLQTCLFGIIVSQEGLKNPCYTSNTGTLNMQVMTSRTWIEGLENPLFETAALVQKRKPLVVGDVFGSGFDFTYWGRHLALSNLDDISSDSFMGIGNYSISEKSKINLTSEGYKTYKKNVDLLLAESTDLETKPSTQIYLQAKGKNINIMGTGDKENYPNGKVWNYDGDLNLDAVNYEGKGTIIVKGDLTLNGPIKRSSILDSNQLGFIVYGDVTIKENIEVHAPILALGAVTFDGNINVGKNVKFFGSLVAKSFNDIDSSAQIFYDKRLDKDWPPGFREFVSSY